MDLNIGKNNMEMKITDKKKIKEFMKIVERDRDIKTFYRLAHKYGFKKGNYIYFKNHENIV